MSSNGFFSRGFTIAVFRPSDSMPVVRCVDDVGDGRQEDAKIFIQKCGGDGIEFTRFCRCTLNHFQDKVISDRIKGL